MKIKIILTIILFSNICIYGQQTGLIRIDFDQPFDTTLMLEKVYLHTDRLNYLSGEDIWYKTYLVNAENNILTSHSNNLYVELISPSKEIIQRQNIQIFEGKGNGDFHLEDSLISGTYYLRAYTNWMRNFEEYIFYKTINIISSLNNVNDSLVYQPTYYNAGIDLQFFPEGGSLLDQVSSTVAFKAINTEGNDIGVSGYIISSENDTILPFESTHFGMGKFSFTPQKELSYYARGKTEEDYIFSIPLPKIFASGICISIPYVYDNHIIVCINTNPESLPTFIGKEFIIKSTCNKLISNTRITIKSLSDTLIIPIFEMPMGIAKITLNTMNELPLNERLVFIPKFQDVKLNITSDSINYSIRSKVNLEINLEGDYEGEANANISLTVIDQLISENANKYASNIASYFLLESEVFGHIEQSGYYFDPDNEDRLDKLDLLLMTQGWRDFKWKYSADAALSFTFPVENEFSIIERLRLYTDSIINPPPNVNINTSSHNLLNKALIDDIQNEAYYRNMIKAHYGLNDTIMLEEFEKVANKIIVKPKDEHVRIYGTPKKSDTYEMTGNEFGYTNLIEFLRGRFAGLQIIGREPNIIIQIRGPKSLSESSEPLWLLDGMPVGRDRIYDFPVEEVDKIEILKSGAELAMFGVRGGSGVISILSKQAGYGLKKLEKTISNKHLGNNDYFKQRQFYSPKYDHSEPENKTPDLRTTIHWEPYIYLDENNKVSVSFYNADKSTTIEVRAEGLTESGIPIIGKTTYRVR
jgi:hypothetical protein